MSLVRKTAELCLKSQRTRGGGFPWKGGFWSDGTQAKGDGFLFGETPPPKGQSRVWESWEMPYYATMVIATVSCTIAVFAKSDMGVDVWARHEAMKQLKEEGIV